MRTLKHNAFVQQIYGKGATATYENQEWWEDDGTNQGCLWSANQPNKEPNKEQQSELHEQENEATAIDGQLSDSDFEEPTTV